jgi:peptide-methionine (S)-S-oxide reductase
MYCTEKHFQRFTHHNIFAKATMAILGPLAILACASPVVAFFPNIISTRQSLALAARREATFGMGCFWKPAEELLKKDGVLDTVAGYTGNPKATSAPSYDSVCFGRDWVEGVRVYYDDDTLTYRELLDAFFEAQEPKFGSRQYASIIFPHDTEQQEVAQEWLQMETQRTRADGISVGITEVEPLTKFYKAEGYHQRYWAKQRPRFAVIIGLITLSSGILDSFIPLSLHSTIDTIANGLTIAIAIYVMAERFLDAKVIEL